MGLYLISGPDERDVLMLQVLYYCPGLREGIKQLYDLSKRRDKSKEEAEKNDQVGPVEVNFTSTCQSFDSLTDLVARFSFPAV